MNKSNNYDILVVDDDVEDHLILLGYFSEAGLGDRIAFSENGQKAMELLEEIGADDQLPKLVILDLNMPIMNGTQTLQQLKQTSRFKNIPIIIFSTSENEIEKRKCLSLGAVDYIVKPSSYDAGKKMIERFSSFIP